MTHQRVMIAPRLPWLPQGRDPLPSAGAVRAGERVYLSGASALMRDGTVVHLGDAAAQANAAIDQLETALGATGGSLKDITKLTTCIHMGMNRKVQH